MKFQEEIQTSRARGPGSTQVPELSLLPGKESALPYSLLVK